MTKLEHWNLIKAEFSTNVPEPYSIEVADMDAPNCYYHPVIHIDDVYSIKGQANTNNPEHEWSKASNDVYAISLEAKYEHNNVIETLSFAIDEYEDMNRVLSNWKDYKPFIDKYAEIQKTICDNEDLLKSIKYSIQDNILRKKFAHDEQLACVERLLKVKNFIEDERMIEKFGGR